jgi:hypothetical protein
MLTNTHDNHWQAELWIQIPQDPDLSGQIDRMQFRIRILGNKNCRINALFGVLLPWGYKEILIYKLFSFFSKNPFF